MFIKTIMVLSLVFAVDIAASELRFQKFQKPRTLYPNNCKDGDENKRGVMSLIEFHQRTSGLSFEGLRQYNENKRSFYVEKVVTKARILRKFMELNDVDSKKRESLINKLYHAMVFDGLDGEKKVKLM